LVFEVEQVGHDLEVARANDLEEDLVGIQVALAVDLEEDLVSSQVALVVDLEGDHVGNLVALAADLHGLVVASASGLALAATASAASSMEEGAIAHRWLAKPFSFVSDPLRQNLLPLLSKA
jgi:Na+/H+-translocating membrane pyrophosphatase